VYGINGYIAFQGESSSFLKKTIYEMKNKAYPVGREKGTSYVDDNCAINMANYSTYGMECSPVFSEDKSKIIIFNGEIYNSSLIKNELEGKGHRFYTGTDMEVMLHAYEEYHEECLNHLNGMFTFAIWNKIKKELFIAKDHIGGKPLYYYKDDKSFIFASELKSLLVNKEIKRQIDYDALANYLRFYYIPEPRSIFKNVYKLLPGHFLKINVKDHDIKIKKYWDVQKSNKYGNFNYEQTSHLLKEKMTNSIKQRLSTNKIGAFLSGGIDSSIVVGLMSQISDKPINTFTIGYKDNKLYDESEVAKSVAIHNNTNHNELFLDFTDINNATEDVLRNLAEPFADSSAIPTYYVSKFTKQQVPIALVGDGGDELFAGYNKYTSVNYSKIYSKIPRLLQNPLEGFINKLPSNSKNKIGSLITKSQKFINGFDDNPLNMHIKLMESLSPDLINNLANFDFDLSYADEKIEQYFNYLNTNQPVNQMMYTDVKFALPNDMLVKVERMTRLNSLLVRSPFLDKDVIDFAFNIPLKYKMRGNNRKIILKDTFNELLPNEVLNAPKKGFGIPIGEWFKKELRPLLLDVLSEENVKDTGLFNYSEIERILSSHFNERDNNANILWTLFVFHYWYHNLFK